LKCLTELPNIGNSLSDKLATIGVTNYNELVAIGSISAVVKIGGEDKTTCYNMLYAIEGAIRGIRSWG